MLRTTKHGAGEQKNSRIESMKGYQPTNRGGKIHSCFSFHWIRDVIGGQLLIGCQLRMDMIVRIPSLVRRKHITAKRKEGGDDALQECVGLRKISLGLG